MARIHQITHDNELVRRKVNFFADYFAYAAETIGTNDFIEIENALSSTEKIIFQITKNPSRCSIYIDSYLTHTSFHDYEDFNEFKTYKELQSLILKYKGNKKSDKNGWIQSTPEFLRTLKLYKRELKRIMFKKALKSIISYLRCVHEIEKHRNDLIKQTDIIVSELILNDRSRGDIVKVFERIITREVGIFPFPKSLKSPEEKELFIKNRTFQQQFDGIYNLLKEDLIENYFIFRVYGLKTTDNFSFTYNRVTFYNPKHEKLKVLIDKVRSNLYLKDFLDDDEYLVLAVIKSTYGSIDIATNAAVEIVNQELQFINKVFTSNGTLAKFSYLLTPDFIDIGWRNSVKDKGYKVTEYETQLLRDNPFEFLKKSPKRLKETLLKNETIYIEALNNKNISTYWQYLETIIPTKQNDGKQIVDMVSYILLLSAESHYKNRLRDYIRDSISPFITSASQLGITIDRQAEIFNHSGPIDLDKLKTEIKHPFILDLINESLRKIDRQDLLKRKGTYERILWDAQAQRNAIIHKGFANEKAMISLNGSLPRLITRLRWTLFDGVKDKIGRDYQEVVYSLKDKANHLI